MSEKKPEPIADVAQRYGNYVRSVRQQQADGFTGVILGYQSETLDALRLADHYIDTATHTAELVKAARAAIDGIAQVMATQEPSQVYQWTAIEEASHALAAALANFTETEA